MRILAIRPARSIPVSVGGTLQSLLQPIYPVEDGMQARPAAFAPVPPGVPVLTVDVAVDATSAGKRYQFSGTPDDLAPSEFRPLFAGYVDVSVAGAQSLSIPVALACATVGFVGLKAVNIVWTLYEENGPAAAEVGVPDNSATPLGSDTTPLELYFLIGDSWPALAIGPAVETLRSVTDARPADRNIVGTARFVAPAAAAAQLGTGHVLNALAPSTVQMAVQGVWNNTSIKYDTVSGGQYYTGYASQTANTVFYLDKWLQATSAIADCFDFAAAVQYTLFTLGAAQTAVKWGFAGINYISPTTLHGYMDIQCNSPFFQSNTANALVPAYLLARTSFKSTASVK